MSDYAALINRHYGQSDLRAKILAALRHAGKNIQALTRDDITTFDEFHGGGRDSTRELARLAGLREGLRVLDVGSGVGGPARTLAAEFGCRVTGVDLTEEFCRAAEMLTSLVGLSHQVTFRRGSALDLPFRAHIFDVVWTQNTLMNIHDKRRLFQEIRRVLKPGGLLAIEAILAGPVPDLYLPAFWAGEPGLNFLSSPQEVRQLLSSSGFAEVVWEDVTQRSIERSRRRRTVTSAEEPAQLSLQVIVAHDVAAKTANALRNYEERRMVAVQAVLRCA